MLNLPDTSVFQLPRASTTKKGIVVQMPTRSGDAMMMPTDDQGLISIFDMGSLVAMVRGEAGPTR